MSVSEEAKNIGKAFLELKKYGAILKNYNSRRSFTSGQSAWVDHVIIYNDVMYLIEVKVGKDTLSPDQLELAEKLLEFNTEVNYFIISTLEEARELVEILLDKQTTEHELWRFRDRTEKVVELTKNAKRGKL